MQPDAPPEKAVVGGLRAQLGAALDSVDAAKLERLVQSIFDMRRSAWAYCPDCRKKVQVEKPDYANQAKAIALLADQAHGRPAETHRIEGNLLVRAKAMKARMPLEELSDAELMALEEAAMPEEERRALAQAVDAAERSRL